MPLTDSRLRLSLLRRFVHVSARDSRTESPTDSRIGHLPKFAPSPARDSELPHVRDSTSSLNHDPRILHIREFEASQVPGFRKSWVCCPWKTCLNNFVKPNVSSVTDLLEFPNTALTLSLSAVKSNYILVPCNVFPLFRPRSSGLLVCFDYVVLAVLISYFPDELLLQTSPYIPFVSLWLLRSRAVYYYA
jgi:hypothetical protein